MANILGGSGFGQGQGGSILGGGQPGMPRVPWGQNPLVTTVGLSLLGQPTLQQGMQNVAANAPAGVMAKTGMQQQAFKQQQDEAEKQSDAAMWNAAIIAQNNGERPAPEVQAWLYQKNPAIADRWWGPQENTSFRMATPEEAAQYGAAAGQWGPDNRFYPLNPPSGMSVEADGQGGFKLVQGPGAGKGGSLTEGQSKDTVYATRAEGALGVLDKVDTALTSFPERFAENDPTGLVRQMQTPEFQQAQQSGLEFLQAILRKDTGAAITPAEQQEYGRVYLPQPGDGPAIIEQKRVSRWRALEAIKAGMPPQAILNQEIALQRSGGTAPSGGQDAVAAPATGAQRMRNPQTGEVVEWNGTEWVPVQ